MDESTHKDIVWLLKDKDDDDSYGTLFEKNGFNPLYLPILEFNYINIDKLNEILKNDVNKYRGVIITSLRSIESLRLSIKDIDLSYIQENWTLYSLSDKIVSRCPIQFSRTIISNGYSSRLCELIIEDYQNNKENTKPFLFLCGNIRLDTVPQTLSNNNIKYDELIVYETITDIDEERKLIFESNLINNKPKWIVFFSPSGIEKLSKIFPHHSYSNFWKTTLKACIGTTTAKELKKYDMESNAIAKLPTPEKLIESINEYSP